MTYKDPDYKPKHQKIADERVVPKRRRQGRRPNPGLKTLKDRLFSHVRQYRAEKVRLAGQPEGWWRREWSEEWLAINLKQIRILAIKIRKLQIAKI